MKLCYRGVDYSVSTSPKSAKWLVKSNLWITLTYRGRHCKPSYHLSNPCILKTVKLDKLVFQKMLIAQQRRQLTYRGIAYAIAF